MWETVHIKLPLTLHKYKTYVQPIGRKTEVFVFMACKRNKSNNEDPSRPKNNMQKKNQLFTITWVIESNKQFSVSNQTLVYPKLKLRESNPLIQQDNTCKRNRIEWKGEMFKTLPCVDTKQPLEYIPMKATLTWCHLMLFSIFFNNIFLSAL